MEVLTLLESYNNMSNIPSISIRELIEAGVHFGHKTMRWNPKMSSYLYGIKDDVHVIDLQQTLPLLTLALEKIYEVAKNNGRILFVGTKTQASEVVSEAAKRCGQYYINHRWLGGTLTNWSTINKSIKKLTDLEKSLQGSGEDGETEGLNFTKKEKLDITRKIAKLEKSLGGIREMGAVPNLLFVIDTNIEKIAIDEAKKLGIPVVAILDSNSDPDNINFPIPGNDDATRAIKLYCRLVSDAILLGMQESLIAAGVDIGESSDLSQIVQLNANIERKTDVKVNKDVKRRVTKDGGRGSEDYSKSKPARKGPAREKSEEVSENKAEEAKSE